MTAHAPRCVYTAYIKAKAEWLARLGPAFNEEAFHAWFTKQVIG